MMQHQVTEHGAPMSLNVNSVEQIWNSAYMRSVRRSMLNEEPIDECHVCYASEEATGQSYRTTAGSEIHLTPFADAASLKKRVSAAGYKVDWRPSYVKIEVGNLCNLKCRMCYAGASSQIERDPVHTKWSDDVDPLHAIWRGDVARIGPEPRIGVRSSGFHPPMADKLGICRWTNGAGILTVPLTEGTKLDRLELEFGQSDGCDHSYEIVVNGKSCKVGSLNAAQRSISIDLSHIKAGKELAIELTSNWTLDSAGLLQIGIPVASLKLYRDSSDRKIQSIRPEHLWQRRETNGPWYMDDGILFDEILKAPDTLRRLYMTGGEPFIIKRVWEIVDFLIDNGAASHIDLEISTNCTRVEPVFLEKLKRFHDVSVYLSLDSIGDNYEYIRYPARWETIDRNVRRLVQESGLRCLASPVVQIYNILNLVDLFRYCDSLDLSFYLNILHQPDRLAIRHLPPKARKLAASRLRQYLQTDCRPAHIETVTSLEKYLEEYEGEPDLATLRELMFFTNDLDASRGQDFRTSNAELYQLLADDGIVWTDERVHAKGPSQTKPARDRVYAWL